MTQSKPRTNQSVLIVASIGCAMTVLDTNIVAIVLPQIARDLNASFAEMEWVISAYILCFASLLLPAGTLADRYGRKRMFLFGITGFALASLLCGAAPSPEILFAARALQGVTAAFLLAPALAIIGHSFHGKDQRDGAWAFWGGVMGLTMVLSPLLGGAIGALAGWRWAFFINLPICAALAAATTKYIPESHEQTARRLDPVGIGLFTGAMLGIIWALIHGQAHGWTSGGTTSRFLIGLGLLALFVRSQMRQAEPMLDLTLFRERRFTGAVLAMFAYASAAQVMASLLPLLLQNGFGLQPLGAGGAMLAFAMAMLIFPHVGRMLSNRLADYQILSLGLAVVAAGNLCSAAGAFTVHLPLLMAGMFVAGAGGGLLNGETQKAIMGAVPPDRPGLASGISTTTRFTGILLGFTLLAGLFATTARDLLANTHWPTGFADGVVAGDLPRAIAAVPAEAQDAARQLALETYSVGFSVPLFVSGLWALFAAAGVYSMMVKNAESHPKLVP